MRLFYRIKNLQEFETKNLEKETNPVKVEPLTVKETDLDCNF